MWNLEAKKRNIKVDRWNKEKCCRAWNDHSRGFIEIYLKKQLHPAILQSNDYLTTMVEREREEGYSINSLTGSSKYLNTLFSHICNLFPPVINLQKYDSRSVVKGVSNGQLLEYVDIVNALKQSPILSSIFYFVILYCFASYIYTVALLWPNVCSFTLLIHVRRIKA